MAHPKAPLYKSQALIVVLSVYRINNQAMLEQTDEQKLLAKNITEALAQPNAPTPGQLASKCGVTEQAVNNWKRTGKITKKNLAILSDMTGWSVSRLMTGEPAFEEPAHQRVAQARPASLYQLVELLGHEFAAVKPATRRAVVDLLGGLAEDPSDASGTAAQVVALLASAKHQAA